MNWLSRLLGPRQGRVAPAALQPQDLPPPEPALGPPPPFEALGRAGDRDEMAFQPPSPADSEPVPALADDEEDEADSLETMDEPDPTVGRYEPLDDAAPGLEALRDSRVAAEAHALSGPHRINAWDAVGPGSLAEALARLEAQGRVRSEVCDDAEAGFYISYEPVGRPTAKDEP